MLSGVINFFDADTRLWLKKLKSVSFKKKSGKIILNHFDSGSTILWKEKNDSVWNIYSKPISYSKQVITKAVRIGYQDSDQITIN